MAKLKEDSVQEVLNDISAVTTITRDFASQVDLTNMGAQTVKTTFDMIFKLLEVFGVSTNDVKNLISRILSGEALTDLEDLLISKASESANETKKKTLEKLSQKKEPKVGLLDTLEYAIKGILILNLKNLFGGCPIDPIIPDCMMMSTSSNGPTIKESIGIEIPINTIDIFGMLKNSPSDSIGSIYYFDNENNTNPNDTWHSMDYNSYLWFVINKGNLSTTKSKNIWDNRCDYYKSVKNGTITEKEFDKFYEVMDINGTHAFIKKNGDPIIEKKILVKNAPEDTLFIKKQFCICEYQEQTNNNQSDVIKLWINAERYYQTYGYTGTVNLEKINKTADISVGINKTIFEFNYDYLMSIKLFDSKTIVANILNSLFNLTNYIARPKLDINFAFSYEKIEEMVKNVIEEVSDENYEGDDFFTFSNAQYDKMLNKSLSSINPTTDLEADYQTTYSDIVTGIKNISSDTNQTQAISNVIELASQTVTKENFNFDYSANFSFDYHFIKRFIEQCTIEIATQVLSPKVALLYAVNKAIMGDIANTTEWEENIKFGFSQEHFIEEFKNLLHSIIVEIVKVLIKELMDYLMEKLYDFIKIFSIEMFKETAKDYKDLITQLIETCTPVIPINYGTLSIEDVTNADIIPTSATPEQISLIKDNKIYK